MKTITYKIRKNFMESETCSLESSEGDLNKLKTEIKKNMKLENIPDEKLKNYDVFFTEKDYIRADRYLQSKIEDKTNELENISEYKKTHHFSYDIIIREILDNENEKEVLENISKSDNFIGWINHPACNADPTKVYFKVDAHWDLYENILRHNKDDRKYFLVIYFPNTEDNITLFKIIMKGFDYEQITDNILLDNETMDLSKFIIEGVDARLGSNFKFSYGIDTSTYYTEEHEDSKKWKDYILTITSDWFVPSEEKKVKVLQTLKDYAIILPLLEKIKNGEDVSDADIFNFPDRFLNKENYTRKI